MSKRASFLRHTTVLFLVLAGGISMVLFLVKYQVHDLEYEHTRLTRELQDEQRALHVLRAEWATLNDPKRIAQLAKLHLDMQPIAPRQVVGADAMMSIPVREMVFGDEASGDQNREGGK
ncbi:cell division protein FtsL [Magnetovibrio blakemorei]|uniref:Cell division protein FtsL n=1 Tax=Magnetovibrio blakemorei TaxID=28181 RepID=A0A1E5Q8V3_9PROT|nr:cell division protein FtsL [Magnetovibrio blakemorei]OEJ67899.1 hypothetical protein BEN30_07830 [Magnetovibrio blakemorei]